VADRRVYRAIFHNRGEVYELHARSVVQGSIFGFVEIEGLLFGERSQMVVDPTEDRLKHEFKDVERFSIPMQAVVRVDQVRKQGAARITSGAQDNGAVKPFPTLVPERPGHDPGES
jgi:hypothetical protein